MRFLASVLLVLTLAQTAFAETRVAMVVGNSNYESVGSLDNPVNDASDITVALEGLGFDVYLGLDVTQAEMAGLTRDFAKAAASADVALFYYAGHGFQVGGENYLIPTDAQITSAEDVAGATVHLRDVLAGLEASPGVKLVFLDACRDNPFGASLEGGGAGDGLARVGTSANFMFVYATQPDNVAYDGTGRNSFFTEAMLSHVYTPGQDISDLMISVRKDVIAATGGRQIPWDNSSLTTQFRFDTSPVTASEETLLYQVAVNAADPRLMQLYVDRYPQGSHVEDVVAFLDDDAATLTRKLSVSEADEEAERLWNLARRSRMRPLLEFYLDQYPEGVHVAEARRLLGAIPRPEDLSPGGVCERLATHPRDATGRNGGVPFDRLRNNAISAIQACSAASAQSPELPHYTALLARAVAASGDLERAVFLYQEAAERGDLRAMVSLAQLTERGTGVIQDTGAALALYERAADGGSTDAMINLAISLFEGAGIPADPDRAVALLRQAADLGAAKATFNLGVLAQQGQVDSPAEALELFERAARDGEYEGYRAAAILLDEGRGVPRDPDAAANMLLRGAASDRGSVVRQLQQSPQEWSRDTLRAVQTRLKTAGFYDSTIDGLGGPSFSAALTAWRNGGFRADVLTE